ncbi:MAG: hypothetical protein AAB198_00020 [Actinomycetota bacterium]
MNTAYPDSGGASVTVIPGEGRVSILYSSQPLPIPPHRSAYLARPDAVDVHPAVAISDAHDPSPSLKTLARHVARYGYAAVVPPGTKRDLAIAVDAFGGDWGDWSDGDRRAVVGIGSGAGIAAAVAGERTLPLVLLSPTFDGFTLPVVAPLLVLTTDPEEGSAQRTSGAGRWVVYRGLAPGFWNDASPDYASAASTDALQRLVDFLDRHLGMAAAA